MTYKPVMGMQLSCYRDGTGLDVDHTHSTTCRTTRVPMPVCDDGCCVKGFDDELWPGADDRADRSYGEIRPMFEVLYDHHPVPDDPDIDPADLAWDCPYRWAPVADDVVTRQCQLIEEKFFAALRAAIGAVPA